jgi:hypothetical protein
MDVAKYWMSRYRGERYRMATNSPTLWDMTNAVERAVGSPCVSRLMCVETFTVIETVVEVAENPRVSRLGQ